MANLKKSDRGSEDPGSEADHSPRSTVGS